MGIAEIVLESVVQVIPVMHRVLEPKIHYL